MRSLLRTRRGLKLAVAGAGLATTAWLGLGATVALAAQQDIGDTGAGSQTLTNVAIGDHLNCQDLHFGDNSNEWYPPGAAVLGDCGTFVALTEAGTTTLYGPPCSGACQPWFPNTYTPWTTVSQSAITHPTTGTNQVVTVVTANGHLRVTQTDTYHVGDEFYNTSIHLEQIAGALTGLSGVLYRAGDCYLQNSDYGYGYTTGGVFCRSADNPNQPNQAPGPRLEGLAPITPGSHFLEASFANLWSTIGTRTQLPDSCVCDSYLDNGVGLSWPFAVQSVPLTQSNAAEPHINIQDATFDSQLIIRPFALAQPSPTPTQSPVALATAAPRTPKLPLSGTAPPGEQRAVLWLAIAVGGIGALGLAAWQRYRRSAT